MRDPRQGSDKIGPGLELQRGAVRTQQQITAHPARQIENHLCVLGSNTLNHLSKQGGVAAGQPGRWVAHMQMDDGGAGRVSFQRGLGNLSRRHGDIRILSDGVPRAGDGTGDEHFNRYHVLLPTLPRQARFSSSRVTYQMGKDGSVFGEAKYALYFVEIDNDGAPFALRITGALLFGGKCKNTIPLSRIVRNAP